MSFKSSRYILYQKIGYGGMGTVYRAGDRLTGEQVALKQVAIPSLHRLHDAEALAEKLQNLRFALAHEFRTLASLRHPHIITVLDYGFDERKQPYFTMTYLPQAQTILEEGEDQSVVRRVQLIQEMLAALAYLHRRDILHRDIKPENVLVANGSVQVLDFGLAAAKEDAEASVGTVPYAAPEIILDAPVSEVTDLYAVGVLAYELFAHRHPFDLYDYKFIDQVLYQPPDLSLLGVDEGLTAVIGKLLEKEPQSRYVSAEAAMVAFSAAMDLPLSGESILVRESYLQAAEFVGRDEEMETLQTALEQAQTGFGSAWLVGGESGVGKTRLLNELQIQAMVDGFLVLRGQGVEEGGPPYQLWIDALRHLVLQADLDDLMAGVLGSIVPDVTTLLAREVNKPPLLDDKVARQRLYATIVGLFQQVKQPVLLILEDLQWIRDSLALLAYLSRQIAASPLLIVGSYRDDERPDLPEELPEMQVIELKRLNQQAVAALSASMLGEAGHQPEILDLLQQETEGNAFFVVEVVRALAEEAGGLRAVSEMALPTRLLPQGIKTIVARRLAGVAESVRALLPGAAVLGRELDLLLLEQLAKPHLSDADLESWLGICADAAIFEVANGRWQFAHDKLRQGLLDGLTTVERTHWHQLAAEAIETVYPDAPEQAGSLVHHWRMVGNEAKEWHYAQIAGVYARQQFLNREAIDYFSYALQLTPASDLVQQYAILQAREQIYHLQGEREAQWQDIKALKIIAEKLGRAGGAEKQVEAALRQANYAEATADYPEAITAANAALQMAAGAAQQASAYLALGRSYMRQGHYDEARNQFMRSLTAAQKNDLPQIEADSFRFLGASAADLGQFEQAKSYYQEALPIYKRIDDRQGESTVLNNMGVAAYSQGDLTGCLTFWEQAERIHDQIGDREGRGRLLTNLSSIYIDLGDYATGREYSNTALQICREINTRFGECFNLINLGLVAHYQNDPKQAEKYSLTAIRWAEEIGSAFLQGLALKDRGYILANERRLAEAETSYQRALHIWAELEQQSHLLETQAGLAQIALLLGDTEQALTYIGSIVEHVQTDELISGMSRPFHVYLVCYEVLLAGGDERATAVLEKAVALLQDQATGITDAKQRQTFLENVEVNRKIVAMSG